MEPNDEYKTPGQLIAVLLENRGWTKRVLATVLEVEETGISKIIAAKKSVTPEMAILLEEVFGVSAGRFLALQRDFDLAKARIVTRPNPARAKRAQLFADLPITEMAKRGWLNVDDVRDVSAVEHAITKFFGAQNLDEINVLPHAARKTEIGGDVTPSQLTWLYRVKQIASNMLAPAYNETKAKSAISKLKTLLSAPEEARHVPKVLLECGIRLVIVEGLKGSKIDGVCFWLDRNSPVIGLSMRFDRMDNFWFVLRHELEHVLNRHGETAPMLDIDMGAEETIAEKEKIANTAAAEFCVPQAKIDSFIARKAPLFPERDFLGLVKILGVHPSLVAGQLQFKTKRWDLFRGHIASIRHCILPSAIVDGWGDVAPVGIS